MKKKVNRSFNFPACGFTRWHSSNVVMPLNSFINAQFSEKKNAHLNTIYSNEFSNWKRFLNLYFYRLLTSILLNIFSDRLKRKVSLTYYVIFLTFKIPY